MLITSIRSCTCGRQNADLPRERNEILKLRETDVKRYFEELRRWANSRMERLRKEGWYKARK